LSPTRWRLLTLKCTKFNNFDWDSASDAAEELTALPRHCTGLTGPTSKERGKRGERTPHYRVGTEDAGKEGEGEIGRKLGV